MECAHLIQWVAHGSAADQLSVALARGRVAKKTEGPRCPRDAMGTEVQMRARVWRTCLTLALAVAGAAGALCGASAADTETIPTWTRLVQLADGRTLVTDGSLALDVALAKPAVLPTVVVSGTGAALLAGYLTAPLPDECSLAELKSGGRPGTYVAPNGVVLNATYVEYLRRTLPPARLRFRLKGDLDPMVILSNGNAVGVLMPMKR
jgi:hypothetical protein